MRGKFEDVIEIRLEPFAVGVATYYKVCKCEHGEDHDDTQQVVY